MTRRHTNEEPQEKLELAAFRLPGKLKRFAIQRCREEDINFSQLMRRAIRRELTEAGILQPQEETR